MIEQPKVLSPWRKIESIVFKALRRIAPNLGTFSFPIYARVLKVNFKSGKVDDSNKRFSAEVQPLTKELGDDSNFQSIKDVPFDSAHFGSGGAVFSVPSVGVIVRIGFMYSDPSFPFIIAATNEGRTIPAGSADEYRIESDDGVIIQIKDGKINIKTKLFNTDLETVINNILTHTHLGNLGVPTSPATAGIPPLFPPPAPFGTFNKGTL